MVLYSLLRRKSYCILLASLLTLFICTACGSSGSTGATQTSTQNQDVTATAATTALVKQITFPSSPTVKLSAATYAVTGQIKNGDSSSHDIYIQAVLLDGLGKQLATSTIFKVEDIAGGATKSYTIEGPIEDIPSQSTGLQARVSVVKVVAP
ncbi:MAG: hypothetical protein JOZ71_10850 [Ktedonobacteraceae bacterium]|nr:hypothetical protein [Ktedonobacteraceae bacterium]